MRVLRSVFRRLQKPVRGQRMSDGSRLLVLPHGGRVLGLFAPNGGILRYGRPSGRFRRNA